ncbi:recombinase family protein [Marinitenerispora sediminis]|uniref:recombinase family protein n=1 Tax=Marinitenerispora sediminis TaxID=1931232 RepID=UPI00131469B7|nr:recombinase family protein [Marinitenerispora sediminis]
MVEEAPRRGAFGEGRPKRRLARHPDERRWETAAAIFRLRVEGLRSHEIRRLLESDPARHPVDGSWTIARVDGLLANPKLTGYQVYNRRATRNGYRWNPVSEWVWSPSPVHPAVVSPDQWRDAQLVTAALKAPRSGLDRVREAAQARGLGMRVVRSSADHVLYGVGDLQFAVRRGDLPDSAADAIITQIGAGR